jgi:hypothetical protein
MEFLFNFVPPKLLVYNSSSGLLWLTLNLLLILHCLSRNNSDVFRIGWCLHSNQYGATLVTGILRHMSTLTDIDLLDTSLLSEVTVKIDTGTGMSFPVQEYRRPRVFESWRLQVSSRVGTSFIGGRRSYLVGARGIQVQMPMQVQMQKKKTLWLLVRERTIPTERPPLVDEI